MHLYVVEFDKYPTLLKIGIAASAEKRFTQLQLAHGAISRFKIYKGKNYKQVERLLHNQFKAFQEKVEGDGGTEFFKKQFDSQELVDILQVSKMKLIKYCFKTINEQTKVLEYKIVETIDTKETASLPLPLEINKTANDIPKSKYSRNLLSKYVYKIPDTSSNYKRNRLEHGTLLSCPAYAEEEFALLAAQRKKGFKSLNEMMRYCFEYTCKDILGEGEYSKILSKQYNLIIEKTTAEERQKIKESKSNSF